MVPHVGMLLTYSVSVQAQLLITFLSLLHVPCAGLVHYVELHHAELPAVRDPMPAQVVCAAPRLLQQQQEACSLATVSLSKRSSGECRHFQLSPALHTLLLKNQQALLHQSRCRNEPVLQVQHSTVLT